MQKYNYDTYTILESENGYKLTNWKENTDILDFLSFTKAYLPPSADTTNFREITVAEAIELENKREELLRLKNGQ